jgi:hypothetical protein
LRQTFGVGPRGFTGVQSADQIGEAIRHSLFDDIVIHGAELMADPGLDFCIEAAFGGRLVGKRLGVFKENAF